MNSFIANHGKLPDTRCDKNQNTVFLFRFVHAKMHENFLRRRHGVFRFLAADKHTDLRARRAFRLQSTAD